MSNFPGNLPKGDIGLEEIKRMSWHICNRRPVTSFSSARLSLGGMSATGPKFGSSNLNQLASNSRSWANLLWTARRQKWVCIRRPGRHDWTSCLHRCWRAPDSYASAISGFWTPAGDLTRSNWIKYSIQFRIQSVKTHILKLQYWYYNIMISYYCNIMIL